MTALKKVDIAFLAGALLGLAALWVLGFFAVRDDHVLRNDFAFIWVGPAAIVHGHDPYDATTWRAATQALGAVGTRGSAYDFPAWTALGLLPLGALPLVVAAATWAYGGLLLTIAAMLVFARRELESVPGAGFAVGLMSVASQPGIVNFYDGEWSLVLVPAQIAVLTGLRDGRQALGAAGMLVLCAKPNLFLVALPALLRAAVARGQRRFLAIVLGVGALMLGATLVVLPGWIGRYAEFILAERLEYVRTTVFPYAMRDVLGVPGLFAGVAVLLALVALALRFDPRSDAYVPVWLAVGTLVTPYLHSYDQLIVIVPLTAAIGALARRDRRLAYALAAYAFVDLVLVAPVLLDKPALALGRETLNAFIIAPIVMLIVAAFWRDRRAARPDALPARAAP